MFDSSKLAMDIWCLGILAYELFIGQKPFKEESQDPTRKVKKILEVIILVILVFFWHSPLKSFFMLIVFELCFEEKP